MNESNEVSRPEHVLSSVACEAPEIGIWVAALNGCRARTYQAIDGIRNDELDWVCPLSTNTIGTLLYHIAVIELDWLYVEILEQEFPGDFSSWFPYDVRDSDGNLTSIEGESFQRHEERLHYARKNLLGALCTMSLSEFRRVRRLKAYDVTPQWVVHHLLQHEAEHRGQIATMRLLFKDFSEPPVR